MCEFVKCTVHIFHVSVWSSQHHKNLLFENIYIQIFLTMVEGLQWMLWLSRMMMAGVLRRWLLRDALTQGWSDCTLWLLRWWVAAEASDSFEQQGLILGSVPEWCSRALMIQSWWWWNKDLSFLISFKVLSRDIGLILLAWRQKWHLPAVNKVGFHNISLPNNTQPMRTWTEIKITWTMTMGSRTLDSIIYVRTMVDAINQIIHFQTKMQYRSNK